MKKFRSPYEKSLGLVHLPRMIDKMRAAGTSALDGYNYKTNGFDAMLLTFLGINGDDMERVVQEAASDAAVLDWVRRCARQHSPEEARAFNRSILDRGQATEEERLNFERRREQRFPGCTNLKYYVDLIEKDEGGVIYERPLPDSFYS